jgi:predicted amino acid-binding ACT domain protein
MCSAAYGVTFHVTGILSNTTVRISNTFYDDTFNMGTVIVISG